MSFGFAFARINGSLEQLATWYKEFMQRTRRSLQLMHHRIIALENLQLMEAPSDEQVERVLRKILAEKFADAGSRSISNPYERDSGSHLFSDQREEDYVPRAIPIDTAALYVDPSAVPSKAYKETFEMLDDQLSSFPNLEEETVREQ